MKKVMFVCAMLVAGSAAFAQKYAVIDANSKLTEACSSNNKNGIDYKKVASAWEDIQKCMENEKSVDYYDTWKVAAKIRNVLTVKVYNDGQAGGNLDSLAYFNGMKDILSYWETYEKCLITPNEKGKLPMKEDAYKTAHKEAQKEAAPLRMQMLSAGYAMLNSHPTEAMGYLDAYLETFSNPLFKELDLEKNDSLRYNAYLYYGMALKGQAKTYEDTLQYLSWYEKVLETKNYGNYACVELMNTYKTHGDMTNWEKYCRYAIDHYEDTQFPKLLIQEYVRTKKVDEAKAMCDKMAAKYPKEVFPVETKALLTFNDKKYTEAVDMFKKLTEIDPTYGRAWCSLGTCYYQLAMENRNKIDTCKGYLNQAIPCYKKAEECESGDSSLWGEQLYRCYHALSDKTNEAKYKKYVNN